MSKLDEALYFAIEAHKGQIRKIDKKPYIVHPMEVAAVVSHLTDNEDVICAALLHDVVEDTPFSLDDVRERFGDRVAFLVSAETENKREHLSPEDTWLIRKRETIEFMRNLDDREVKMVLLGDKLANARAMLDIFNVIGDDIWNYFNQKDKALQKWYYESISDILRAEFSGINAFEEYCKILNIIFG